MPSISTISKLKNSPLTLSITQFNFFEGIKRLRSLDVRNHLQYSIRVNKFSSDSKLFSHVINAQRSIAFQQLSICLASHFSDVYPGMTGQVSVSLEELFDFCKCLEINGIFTDVEGINETIQRL